MVYELFYVQIIFPLLFSSNCCTKRSERDSCNCIEMALFETLEGVAKKKHSSNVLRFEDDGQRGALVPCF